MGKIREKTLYKGWKTLYKRWKITGERGENVSHSLSSLLCENESLCIVVMFFPKKAFFSTSLSYTNFLPFLLFSLGSCPICSVTYSSYSTWNVVRYIKTGVKTLFAHSNSKSIINSFSIFLYYLDSEQWYLTFTYLLFQIHFLTDSLSFSSSHLNIISSFILYSFLTTTHLPTFFYSIPDYYN